MALGYKGNETRSWPTSYRGPLAIHAAKTKKAIKDADEILQDAGLFQLDQTTKGATKWPLGEIIAVVDLVDCKLTQDVLGGLSQCERAMGDYSPYRFAWVTKNLRRVKPFPLKGSQGLKPLPPEVEKALEYL